MPLLNALHDAERLLPWLSTSRNHLFGYSRSPWIQKFWCSKVTQSGKCCSKSSSRVQSPIKSTALYGAVNMQNQTIGGSDRLTPYVVLHSVSIKHEHLLVKSSWSGNANHCSVNKSYEIPKSIGFFRYALRINNISKFFKRLRKWASEKIPPLICEKFYCYTKYFTKLREMLFELHFHLFHCERGWQGPQQNKCGQNWICLIPIPCRSHFVRRPFNRRTNFQYIRISKTEQE